MLKASFVCLPRSPASALDQLVEEKITSKKEPTSLQVFIKNSPKSIVLSPGNIKTSKNKKQNKTHS